MGRRRTWRERRPLTWRLATKVSKIVEKKEVCFCSFCFVLRVYEIECFFKRNYTWLEDLVLLLSSLVVIIVVEANLTVWIDGTMVGCYDTPDMWWVITSYFVSPGSVMAPKREREREKGGIFYLNLKCKFCTSPGKICSPPDAPLLFSETLDGIQA